MYELLYKFLVKYKTIDLPGIGRIFFNEQPAESRFVDQNFLPPRYLIGFERGRSIVETQMNDAKPQGWQKTPPSRKLFSWLASHYEITEKEAVIRFDDFVVDLKGRLDAGDKIMWSGVGVLEKDSTGEIVFHHFKSELPWLEPTSAKKVIRDNAEHTMLVGEREKTSVEMTEILLRPKSVKEKRGYWWVWPLAVIIAIFIFLGWYFSEHGISGDATGNNHKVSSH
jgi:hypothetical protein